MDGKQDAIELNGSAGSIPAVPLTPPPMPAASGKKTAGSACADKPSASYSITGLDLNDKEAVMAAAKKWMEEQQQSNRACIS